MVKNTLRKKLFRDMWQSRMQFVAIVLLCALGTWCFSGLDAAWRMFDASATKYYQEQCLADLWVKKSNVDNESIAKVKALDGVKDVQARTTLELTADLPHELTVIAHAYDGEPRINIPLMRSGNVLSASDIRGILVEEQFFLANGLQLGDTLSLKLNGYTWRFIIRGTCLSAEYIITSNDVTPDPENYGFVIFNAAALDPIAMNEMLIITNGDCTRAIQALFPDALIIDHQTQASVQNTDSDIQMFKNLSYLFPLLAFAVAALIVLTTLTRMIENQRMQMGTLKALGYHDGPILKHYMCYALYPSLVGALLGLFTGRATLPYILWNMESHSFVFPYQIQAPISLLQWLVCLVAVVLSLGICLYTYRKNAHEVTAALLRPKPPKAGKKLFLERFTHLWRSMGFNGKMVTRNLFRNKLRTMMSLVGLLCCTMLIITSLGLQDSIRYFVGNYYHGTIQYTVRADLTGDAGSADSYQKRIEAKKVEAVMAQSVSLRTDTHTRATVLTVLEDDQTLFNLGKHESFMQLPANGIALTRKLADVMQLSLGDTVSVYLPGDNEAIRLEVTAICDVNIGQGAYIVQSEWESLHKGAFSPTALMLLDPTDETLAMLESMDEMDALKFPDQQYEQMLTILNSMMGVFSLMSGAALGLAFVILYNMGILNFAERQREYATLKVLGYHQKEIRRLMINENNIITILGVIGGIFPGKWLTAMVLKTCESDNMVFAASVAPKSILIACVVTTVFSYMITRLLTHKVRSIDMVEALKSVE